MIQHARLKRCFKLKNWAHSHFEKGDVVRVCLETKKTTKTFISTSIHLWKYTRLTTEGNSVGSYVHSYENYNAVAIHFYTTFCGVHLYKQVVWNSEKDNQLFSSHQLGINRSWWWYTTVYLLFITCKRFSCVQLDYSHVFNRQQHHERSRWMVKSVLAEVLWL